MGRRSSTNHQPLLSAETMNKIYIVTTGEYSDYSICGAFSTEEAAEAFRYYHNYDAVEEWDVDQEVPKFSKDRTPWRVNISLSKFEVTGVYQQSFEDSRDDDHLNTPYVGKNNLMNYGLTVHVLAADEQGACKVAMERARAFLAGQTTLTREMERKCAYTYTDGAVRQSAIYYNEVVRVVDNTLVVESSDLVDRVNRIEEVAQGVKITLK